MNNEFLKDIFRQGNEDPDVSTLGYFKQPTEAQKAAIWQELKAQEEIFRKDRSIIFKQYK